LRALRAELDRIRSAKADKPVNGSSDVDVKPLLGLRRALIADALAVSLEPCEGPSNCEFDLSFHKLPAGWRGGGTTLRLHFGRDDTAVVAEWFETR
jgi:hypothetical protein